MEGTFSHEWIIVLGSWWFALLMVAISITLSIAPWVIVANLNRIAIALEEDVEENDVETLTSGEENE